ncbi:plasmid stabilization system protein [Bombiscardovia nodaiensis]|uniref:Plasmid stabilization system protein n=1 Tax=Bombiscardovia nodaiensis TaxID=2932181 RepID=A0ABN6SAZ8_9BIFI|nr:plasmid stabilization system protein [Bombiscardovia nodaiensis]
MNFSVTYTKQALKQLRKLDAFTRATILQWIDKNLEGTPEPRGHGKGLSANRAGLWRYRVGDYRILATINDQEITIVVLSVGHRSSVYR